jgi:hypothetical protein
MPDVHYIDLQGGAGAGTTPAAPRNTLPAIAAGDVWLFRRGSSWSSVNQFAFSQPLAVGAFGDVTLPKPAVTFNVTASSVALSCTQDCIFSDIHFKDFQPATNAGHGLDFRVRGGGALNSGPGAGGIFINCDFSNFKGNAVMANPNDGTTPTASSDFMVFIGCTWNGIGDDAMFLKTKYLRVGWCDIRNVSVGTTTGDCIHNMDAFLEYAWIHDNYLDHTNVDSKQCIMLDDPAAGNVSGLALIERNVMLGALTGVDDNIPNVEHVLCNSQVTTILRSNYMKSKRFGALVGPAAGVPIGRNEVYSNVFDVMAAPSSNNALVLVSQSDVSNNTFFRRNASVGDNAIGVLTSIARSVRVDRNLFVGFSRAIQGAADVMISQDRNAYFNCVQKANYVGGTNDVDLTSLPIPGPARMDFRPSDAALFFRSFDRRYPDFFGTYAPAGIAHIGAMCGAL